MKGMLYRKCKRPAAAILAAVMVLTAVNLPETSLVADAAAGWEWNADYSASRYPKIKGLTAVAASEQETGEDASVNNDGTPAGSRANAAVDGCKTSYWHSNHGDTALGTGNQNTTTGTNNNVITVSLGQPATIAGVTYLPRQDALGNGPWRKFTIEVKKQNSDEWTQVTAKAQDCSDVNLENGVFEIDYHGATAANWDQTRKFEREIIFASQETDVEKIRFTIFESTGENKNRYLTAAEIGVLSPEIADELTVAKKKLQTKINEMRTKPENTYAGLSDFIARMEDVLNTAQTVEEVSGAITELEAFEYKFENEKGEGKYLSDLQELSPDPGYGSYRKDININGDDLIRLYTVDNDRTSLHPYTKGVGLHSRSYNGGSAGNPGSNPADVIYNVSGYDVFSADIGIDAAQASGSASNVIFKVLLSKDGTTYAEVYSSEEMTAGKAAKHIEVDLLKAQKMKIVVDSNGPDYNDHAVLADAKVYQTGKYKPETTEEKELKIESAIAASVQPNNDTEGSASFACDKKITTMWHTKWSESCSVENRWIDFKLKDVSYVDAVSMLMRLDGGNGTISESEIWVSEKGHKQTEGEAADAWKADYTKVASGVWNTTKKNLKTIHFDPVKAQHIRVVAKEITHFDNNKDYATMTEFKAYGTPVTGVTTAPAPQFIKFLGGSLRTTPNDGTYERANMRFGYEIATKNDAVGYKTAFTEWGFEYNIVGGSSYSIVGQKKIDSKTQGMEISNLVVTNIPVVGYQKDVNCCCYVTYGLGNNEKVKLYSSEIDQTRNVAEVATAVVKNEAEESPENVAYAKELLKKLPNAQ